MKTLKVISEHPPDKRTIYPHYKYVIMAFFVYRPGGA